MDEAGRWTDEPLLPELPPPPADRIIVRGAQLVRVYTVDHPDPRRRRGYSEAVILAWARTGAEGWGVLLAWGGSWRQQIGGRTTVKARWSWCRLREDRVKPVRPPPLQAEDEWHGHHPLSEFSEAVRLAAQLLPEELREAALTPAPPAADAPPGPAGGVRRPR